MNTLSTNKCAVLYVILCLLTCSIEQSSSWDANRFSASQGIPRFYGTRRFITALTSAHHLSLSWSTSILSIPPLPHYLDSYKYYSPIYAWVSQVVAFPQVSPPKNCISLITLCTINLRRNMEKHINLLKPTGYVMHQQFNIQQLYALPTLYLCVLYLSENRQRIVPRTA